jgi:peptide/nickel transport system substrate-binding protein
VRGAAAIAALAAATACGPGTRGTNGSSSVLTVGVPDDVTTLDGIFASADRSLEVIMNCYEPLMTHAFREEGTIRRFVPEELSGGALEDLSLAGDGLTWTLRVRRGVRFPGGGEVTARTVARLFERNFSVPGSGGRFVLQEIGRVAGIESIRVTGEYELEVRTEERNPLFARILVLSNATPFDPEVLAKPAAGSPWAETFLASNTAGAGPYRLDRWTPGVEVALVRNEFYWRGPAPIERVVMKVVPAAADRMMLLSSGALDVVERLSAEEIEALSRVEGVRILSIPSTSTVQLGMNNRMPPFDDVRVRQAVAHALPYDELRRHVYFGRARRAVGPVPLGFPGRVSGDSPYEHDPGKSRALLAAAGFGGGLDVELAMDSGSPDDETLAVFVRAALARVGIRARIRKLTPAVFAEERARRRLPLFLDESFWWVYDPAYALLLGYTREGFLNHVGYSSPEVDRIVASARSAVGSERERLLEEAERLIIEDVPSAWIVQPNFNLAMRDRVDGYVHFNDHMVRFFYLRKEPGVKREIGGWGR